MASKAVASIPTLMSKLVRHNAHRVAPFATRSFCIHTTPYKSYASPFASAIRTFSARPPMHQFFDPDKHGSNPFLRFGEQSPCRVDKTKNDCYIVRVDVPGIADEGNVMVWVESGYIYFSATDSKIPDYKYEGRVYGGSFTFNWKKFDSNSVRSEVRNGVLWIAVPRLKKKDK